MRDAHQHAVPYRPGPIGRLVRLGLGLLLLSSAVDATTSIIDGADGPPNAGLFLATVFAAWLTPRVLDIGLGLAHGRLWIAVGAAGVAVSAFVGLTVGKLGAGLTTGLLGWIAVIFGSIGAAFVVAAVLRTPGCEMRAPAQLLSILTQRDAAFLPCPGPLQPLDEWEARSTGRARPHIPT